MSRLFLLAVFVLTALPAAAATPSPRWMAHCAANLKGEKLKTAVVRKYCVCMGEVGEEEEEMLTWSQSDLERSYPPAHRQCHDKARRVRT